MKSKAIFLSIFFILFTYANLLNAKESYGAVFIKKCAKEIDDLLECYKRPFTILIVGDIANRLGFHIARKYNKATCVLINSRSKDTMLYRCRKENLNNLLFIKKRITGEQLQRLSECEHFDVVIEMDSIDDSKEWESIKNAFFQMGDYFISLASKNKKKQIRQLDHYVRHCIKEKTMSKEGDDLLNIYKTTNPFLLRKNYDREFFAMPKKYYIESTFEKKILHKKRDGETLVSHWCHGINLNSFANLGGGFPDKKEVIGSVIKLQKIPHEDISMHNMVIQGKKVIFIDFSPVSGVLQKPTAQKFNIIVRSLRKMLEI